MKKTGYVLGIVGGCFALVIAFASLLGGLFFIMGGRAFFSEIIDAVNQLTKINGSWNIIRPNIVSFSISIIFFYVFVMCLAAGILGLIGAVSVCKDNVKAGVLMLVGAGLCFITPAVGFIPMVLLLLGGIFALSKEKPEQNVQAQK
ncbi:MAG: hypothetical protein WDA65_07120 [Christensenellales bacterium]